MFGILNSDVVSTFFKWRTSAILVMAVLFYKLHYMQSPVLGSTIRSVYLCLESDCNAFEHLL